jgi:hypothetical protein
MSAGGTFIPPNDDFHANQHDRNSDERGSTWLVMYIPSLRMSTNLFIHCVVLAFSGEDETLY